MGDPRSHKQHSLRVTPVGLDDCKAEGVEQKAPPCWLAENRLGGIDHHINALSELLKSLHFRTCVQDACVQDYISRVTDIGYQVEKALKLSYFGAGEAATCRHQHQPGTSDDTAPALVELSDRSISPGPHLPESYAPFAGREVTYFAIGLAERAP